MARRSSSRSTRTPATRLLRRLPAELPPGGGGGRLDARVRLLRAPPGDPGGIGWRRRRRATRPAPPRLPPGQKRERVMPVRTFGRTPDLDLDGWRLGVFGLVEEPLELAWDSSSPCPGRRGERLPLRDRLEPAGEPLGGGAAPRPSRPRPCRPEARFAAIHCHGGFAASLELEALLADDVILAHRLDGRALAPDHGWPLRLVVPARYAYKSAKWVMAIELTAEERPGFYERRATTCGATPGPKSASGRGSTPASTSRSPSAATSCRGQAPVLTASTCTLIRGRWGRAATGCGQ